MMKDTTIRRGRPRGYRLSDESKRKISVSRTGQKHSERTKQTIKRGVKRAKPSEIPLEVILEADLNKLEPYFANGRYWNIYFSADDRYNFPGGCMRLSVAIMTQKLGRHLEGKEQIHHNNSIDDNFGWGDLYLCENAKHHAWMDELKRRRNLIKQGEYDEVAKAEKRTSNRYRNKKFKEKYSYERRKDIYAEERRANLARARRIKAEKNKEE